MRISYFFKSSWVLQLVVGIGLFLCSFYIEYRIMQAFISPQAMALFLAITLETGKVVAIVWHYYLNHLSYTPYPGSVRLTSALFRLGLVVLSLVCSQLFLNAHLDRPHLEKVRAAETETVKQRLDTELERLNQGHLAEKKALAARHEVELAERSARYDRRIGQLEALLLEEMDNVVGGVFRGPRYVEFERQLAVARDSRRAEMEKLLERQSGEISQMVAAYNLAMRQTRAAGDKKLGQLKSHDFARDERVNDPHIVAFLKVSQSLFDASLEPLQFVFLFSLLLSTLLEAGIMLAFSTITVSMSPVLRAQHEETLEKETLKAKVSGEAERDEVRHDAAMGKINRAGRQTVEKAEAHFFSN